MRSEKFVKTHFAFTLIELLIVIAILGILATIVLVLVNPAERLSQTRDAGRIAAVAQLGRAISQYFVVNNEVYPDPFTWNEDLVGIGDINNFPSGITYSRNMVTACTSNAAPVGNGTFCYKLDSSPLSNGAIVYAKLESSIQVLKCNLIGDTYIIYSTADGKTGIICSNTEPSPWEGGTKVYLE